MAATASSLFQEQWTKELASWGYVALLVDSNGAVGVGRDCDHWPGKANNRSFDAFGAFDYLSSLHDVDSARIGVLGWDTGGLAVMRVLATRGEQVAVPERFAAGVALYPVREPRPPMSAPLLILIGDKDDCSPTERVQHSAQEEAGPYLIRIEILADVGHGFDDPRFAEPADFAFEDVKNCFNGGTTMAYSQAARDVAVEQARAFLEEALK